jgi:hypothetical protein
MFLLNFIFVLGININKIFDNVNGLDDEKNKSVRAIEFWLVNMR